MTTRALVRSGFNYSLKRSCTASSLAIGKTARGAALTPNL